MSGVLVRRVREGDGPAVAELLTELGYPSDGESVEARLGKLRASPNDYVLVAEKESEVVGVIKLHVMMVLHEDHDFGRLTALVVREPSRGQGIGHRFVAAAEEIARGRGCRRIEVTSAEHRTDAHDFYRHLGYAETSRRFIKHIPEVGGDVTEGRKLARRTTTFCRSDIRSEER